MWGQSSGTPLFLWGSNASPREFEGIFEAYNVCFFPRAIFSQKEKKMSVRQANIQSLFSLSLLITAPILLLLFTSVSQSYICGKKSLSFCRQQQVEPKGVHKFLINEFKYELFTQFLCIYFILAACAFTSQQCT